MAAERAECMAEHMYLSVGRDHQRHKLALSSYPYWFQLASPTTDFVRFCRDFDESIGRNG